MSTLPAGIYPALIRRELNHLVTALAALPWADAMSTAPPLIDHLNQLDDYTADHLNQLDGYTADEFLEAVALWVGKFGVLLAAIQESNRLTQEELDELRMQRNAARKFLGLPEGGMS